MKHIAVMNAFALATLTAFAEVSLPIIGWGPSVYKYASLERYLEAKDG